MFFITNSFYILQFDQESTVIKPILQIRKLRHEDIVRTQTTWKWQSQVRTPKYGFLKPWVAVAQAPSNPAKVGGVAEPADHSASGSRPHAHTQGIEALGFRSRLSPDSEGKTPNGDTLFFLGSTYFFLYLSTTIENVFRLNTPGMKFSQTCT